MNNFVRCGRWQGVCARGKTLYYPIWLAYAAGVLEERSHNVRLVDAIANHWDKEETLKDIKEFNPDLIVVDTNFSSMENDVKFAVTAKSFLEGKTKVIAVGPPAAVYAEHILKGYGADIVARKEIDYTLSDLADVITNGNDLKEVQGISYIDDKNNIIHNDDRPFLTSEELDKLPFVSQAYKKHLNINAYWLDHTLNPMIQIMTSRGCPNQCTFCSWPENMMGRKYRMRSAKNIINEIEWILANLPEVKEIFFEDDAFTINKSRVLEFTDEIKRRHLRFVWSCQTRANLDYETMRRMRESGCRLLDVGFESGSNEVLKNIKKALSKEKSRQFAIDAKRAGLMILGDFVFGFTGETKDTIVETINFISEIKPNLLQIAVATPIPGTGFYNWVKENGYLMESDMLNSIDENGFQKCIISYPWLTNEMLEKYVVKALKNYYLSLSFVPVALRNVLRKNGFHELKGMIISAGYFCKYALKASQ